MPIRNVATLGLLLCGLFSASAARAQLVSDPLVETATGTIATDSGTIAAYSNTINAQTGNTATNTAATQKTLTTPPSDVSGLFSDQDGTSELNPMPDTAQVVSNVSYKTPQLTGSGQNVYNNNNTDVTGTDPEAADLRNTITTSANIEGMAIDNLKALQKRLSELSEMNQALASAPSITEVAAINGRIAVEALAVQAQQAQAANLDALAIAQNEINLTNREQAIRQEHQNTITLFHLGL